MNITKNEKNILKLLLDNGRVSDVEMAQKLKISTQAVGKIRKKLEDSGVIESYSCDLNYEMLGLNVFSLSLMKLKNTFWKNYGDLQGRDLIKKTPRTILSCLSSGSDVNFITLQAFRDVKEMDRYFHLMNTHYDHEEIVRVFSFSPLNFIKNSARGLFKLVLDEKPIVPPPKDELEKL